jgi:hypothetical protein
MLSLLGLIAGVIALAGCGENAPKSARMEKTTTATKKNDARDVQFEAPPGGAPAPRPQRVPEDGVARREAEKAEAAPAVPSAPRPGAPLVNLETAGETRKGPGSGGGSGVGALEGKPAKAEKPQPPKPPQVWHRDGGRPSFARVYVGDGNALELVSLHVSVLVEGPRARTLVDHVFRNPHGKQLEGTFEYPLPAGASPSYYAMFLGAARDVAALGAERPQAPGPRFNPQEQRPGKPPVLPEMLPPAQLARQVDTADWGKLQEARIVPPEKALEAYEEVVRGRIDPALLEYASGNTFRGRVFPIAPNGYNRVILAYEETLPVTGGQMVYRYALPTCKLHELRFSLQADARECKDAALHPKDARKEAGSDHVLFTKTWSDTKPAGDVIFSARPTDPTVQATSGKHGDKGPNYLYARLRPQLEKVGKETPFARHAIFLLDTSLSEHPDRFGVSMKLLQAILASDPEIEHFNILTFNAGAAWVEPKGFLPNTKEGREAALGRLDGLVLEGATDLSAALEKLVDPGFALDKGTPLACFLLSDGHLTWGETETAPLVARFRKRCPHPTRFFCYRTGLGEENAELYDALTREGGGTFQCYGEAEVAAAAQAHRRQCLLVEKVRFEGSIAAEETIVAGRRSAVYPDGELIVACHTAKPGKGTVVVEGTFAGQRFTQSFPVEVREEGELAARGYGEIAVASLLALNDPWVEDLITAYSQEFNIASRSASFLVLEREEDYKRFNLDEQRQKVAKGDLQRWLEDSWAELGNEPKVKHALGRLLHQIDGRTKVWSAEGGRVKDLLGLLSEEDCALPRAEVKGTILREKDADKNYLHSRAKDRRAIGPYLEECQRRHGEGDADGAVRVLSSILEEHAGRGDALRLVGYRLLDLNQPAQAARLFLQVLRQRPFEPHSFRDLARSLEDAGKQPLAALLYEGVLAGTWHNRFGDALKAVTREEYARSLRTGLRDGKLTAEQRRFFEQRLGELRGAEKSADLRVSITWNTDATDIDLHILEPDRTKVYYQATRSRNGGELSQDQTQGYGPERYQIAKAPKGEFQVLVHYYRANPNLLGGETHVSVTITRHAGSDKEKVERRTVILKREGEMVPVAKVRY